MNQTEGIRSFIAIELPPAVKQAIQSFQDYLKPVIPGVRWVKPESIHLTLKFLGDVPEEKLHGIGSQLGEWVSNAFPYTLKPGGFGAFPNKFRPRVLWIGFSSVPEIHDLLVSQLEAGLVAHGFKKEKKPHRPHLTIARVRVPGSTGRALDRIGGEEPPEFPEFLVNRIILFRSDLEPSGARYTELVSTSFAGR